MKTFFVVSFDNYMQHDAHEFLNYLLNTVADLLQGIAFCFVAPFERAVCNEQYSLQHLIIFTL
jgi:uncharacterized UBP type Zn finger protein